jgi:GNAT superfamily N-acetyltransferase
VNEVAIEKVRANDILKLRRIFKQAVATDFAYFPLHYQRQVLRQNTAPRLLRAHLRPERVVLAARNGGQMVGFIIGSAPARGLAQIYWLYVAPSFRGGGLGDKLLFAALEKFKRLRSTKAALATHKYHEYYAKRGFRLERVEQQFPEITMHIMSIELA